MSTVPFAMLSNREHEVLRFVAQDKTDREIAHHLGIRERTVRAHVSRIILKLGVASRVGAAVAFAEWTVREYPCQCNGSPWRKANSDPIRLPATLTSGPALRAGGTQSRPRAA